MTDSLPAPIDPNNKYLGTGPPIGAAVQGWLPVAVQASGTSLVATQRLLIVLLHSTITTTTTMAPNKANKLCNGTILPNSLVSCATG